MGEKPVRKTAARTMAFCGLMASVGTAVMLLGGLIPVATYCCPVLASLVLVPVLDGYGGGMAMGVYAVVALLSMLLSPDKEAALVFLVLGYYPVLQPKLERLNRVWKTVCKVVVFAAALAVAYGLLAVLIGLPPEAAPLWLKILFGLMGLTAFLLYDVALGRIVRLFRKRFHGGAA